MGKTKKKGKGNDESKLQAKAQKKAKQEKLATKKASKSDKKDALLLQAATGGQNRREEARVVKVEKLKVERKKKRKRIWMLCWLALELSGNKNILFMKRKSEVLLVGELMLRE